MPFCSLLIQPRGKVCIYITHTSNIALLSISDYGQLSARMLLINTVSFTTIPLYTIIINTCVTYTGVGMYILNTEFFGYIIKDRFSNVNEAAGKFFEFKLSTLGELDHFTAACCMHVETYMI